MKKIRATKEEIIYLVIFKNLDKSKFRIDGTLLNAAKILVATKIIYLMDKSIITLADDEVFSRLLIQNYKKNGFTLEQCKSGIKEILDYLNDFANVPNENKITVENFINFAIEQTVKNNEKYAIVKDDLKEDIMRIIKIVENLLSNTEIKEG